MVDYRIAHTSDLEDMDFETLISTHPAPVGTFIVCAEPSGKHHKTAVVLWGVLKDGTPVPITLTGVWDGASNTNNFVLHPGGSCSKYEGAWDSLEQAAKAMLELQA
jgi:hypothetical protein